MNETVILAAARTPIGSFQGVLSAVPAARLGAAAIAGAIARAGIQREAVSDVVMGNVLQAGQGQAPARQAALSAGLPSSVRTVTVHKVCGSGMQAVMQASHMLCAGMGTIVVAGGMENMSRAPFLLPNARDGYRLGHQQVLDSIIIDGLWDPHNDLHMGGCAEQCVQRYGFTREQQDAFAAESFRRANAAQQAGRTADEIVPVEVAGARGAVQIVAQDEGPARVNYEKMPTLKPVFDKAGTITAANASTLNDGAAALVIAAAATASSLKLQPVARLVSFGVHAQDPVWFTTAPIQAAEHALREAGWDPSDVDLWEVNEAFAAVALAFMQELKVPHDRLNIRGGAIALGHPIGCSGARVLVTLIAALREQGLKRGLAAICIGGGEAMAACIELL